MQQKVRMATGRLAVPWRPLAAAAVVLALAGSSGRADTVLDVSSAAPKTLDGTAFTGGGFVVSNTTQQPTGTGVIDSFLRVQETGQERGFNTGAATPPQILDDKAGNFTRPIQLSEVPVVTINGVQYREFLLDVNQVMNGKISLNQVQIFQSSADVGGSSFTLQEATSTKNASISFSNASLVFQMSNVDFSQANANQVVMQSDHGSGSGDMFLYVANSLFSTDPSKAYVTLFSQFGNPTGTYSSNDGFEEWAVMPNSNTVVPEPSTIALALSGLVGAGFAGLRRLRRSPVATV